MNDKLQVALLERLDVVSQQLNLQILEVQSIAAALRMNDLPNVTTATTNDSRNIAEMNEMNEMKQTVARLEQLVKNMQSDSKASTPEPEASQIDAPVVKANETEPLLLTTPIAAPAALPAVKPVAKPDVKPAAKTAAKPAAKAVPPKATEPLLLTDPINK